MTIKVGDSVLYVSAEKAHQHTGIITEIIAEDLYFPYRVYWINNQWTNEGEIDICEYRQKYLDTLTK
jgi:hypothetical protein